MGLQEFTIAVVGACLLLAALIYAVMRAGRTRRTRASDQATRRNFDKE